MGISKESIYGLLIKYQILKAIEDGSYQNIVKRWYPKQVDCAPEESKPLGIEKLAGLSLMVPAGAIAAFLVLGFELFLNKRGGRAQTVKDIMVHQTKFDSMTKFLPCERL